MTRTKLRIFFGIILLLSIVWASWWLSIALMLLGSMLYRGYWEALVAGVVTDLLFGTPSNLSGGIHYIATALGLVFFIISSTIRQGLSFTNDHA